jgi:pimeloyl-ACP methyl ester carboxylesterase
MEQPIVLKNNQLTYGNPERSFLYDLSYLADGKDKPLILFLHGFKGFKDWGTFDLMMDYFTRQHYVFIKMNFSHNGTTLDSPLEFKDLEAFGKNNFIIELEDVQAMLDQLFKGSMLPSSEWNKKNVVLMAHSRGGSIAILKGSEDTRVHAVVTLAAVADLEKKFLSDKDAEVWKNGQTVYIDNARTGQKMPVYPQFLQSYQENKARLDVKAAAAKLKHFLILHGSADTTVPVEDACVLKNSNSTATLEVVENADHTFGGKHPYEAKELPPDLKKVCATVAAFLLQSSYR